MRSATRDAKITVHDDASWFAFREVVWDVVANGVHLFLWHEDDGSVTTFGNKRIAFRLDITFEFFFICDFCVCCVFDIWACVLYSVKCDIGWKIVQALTC